MLNKSIAAAIGLQRDEKGGVAILFGLSAVAICMFAGLAIDFGRTYSSKAKIEAAIDAATLAAAKGMRLDGLSETEAKALAKVVFDENIRQGAGKWTDIHSVLINVNASNSTASMVVDATVKTTFGAIAGIQRMGAPGAAAAVFESRDVEVSLQLDLTGSMCSGSLGGAPCNDHPKIQGLKDATKDLVNILLPAPSGQAIRIGYAPFTAGVNLGVHQSAVTGGVTTANGCVYERKTATSQATDLWPVGNDRYMVAADLQAAPHNVANPRTCPGTSVLPLTGDKQLLLDTVDTFVADGYTAGHNGTAWAWNLVSPNFGSVWPSQSRPAAYGDADKSVILMTDGEYNTKNGRSWNATQVSAIAIDTCNAMKQAGIRVYTVGFALGGNQTAIDTLSACASPGDFKQAATPEELRTVFRQIANNIARLRLTN
jgi:Flp pilus assembly protein TadG